MLGNKTPSRAERRRALRKDLKDLPWRPFRDYHGLRHKKMSFALRQKVALEILRRSE